MNLMEKTGHIPESINIKLDSVTGWDFVFFTDPPHQGKDKYSPCVKKEPRNIWWPPKQTGKECCCPPVPMLYLLLGHIAKSRFPTYVI